MSEVSAKSFLGLLQKSGLCEDAKLKASLNELKAKTKGAKITLDQLTTHLLEAGLITDWHLKKLLAGRYKGYFLGKYKLLRHLGTGGMSTVYLAQHTIFNQQRAIKVLPRDRVADKTYLERFYREGRAAASLNHRNIVRVYDIGNEGDTHYLVMEYVDGIDLDQQVNQHGPLEFDTAIDYIIQALTGLQHAHENDLVHRDVKPANLLVTPEGVVKILDLGLALFREEDTSLTVMHNERVLGTADYLSPEQAVDSHRVDHRSDMYSLGCTFYFLLTGKPPFHEGPLAQRIAMHQSREPQDIRDFRTDCPPELVDIIQRMMKKKPRERYQTCDELATELRGVREQLFASSTSGPKKPITGERTQPVKQRQQGIQPATGHRPGPKSSSRPSRPSSPTKESPSKGHSTGQPLQPDRGQKRPRQQPKRPEQQPQQKKPNAKQKPQTTAQSEHAKAKSAGPSSRQNRIQTQPNQGTSKQEGRRSIPRGSGKPSGRHPQTPQRKQVEKGRSSRRATSTASGSPRAPTQKSRPTGASKQRSIPAGNRPQAPVVVTDQPVAKAEVSVQQLRQFASQNRDRIQRPIRPGRKSIKEQLLMIGVVLAMLLLLAITLILAIRFTSGNRESGQREVCPPIDVPSYCLCDTKPLAGYNGTITG